MNVARSTLYLTVVRGSNQILGFVSLALFTQALGAATMGSYFLFHTLVAVTTTVVGVGISGAVKKRISEGEHAPSVLGSGLLIKTVTLSIITVAVLIGRGFVADYVGADLVVLLVVTIALDEYSGVFKHTVAGELSVDKTAAVQFANQVTYVTMGLLSIQVGYGVRAPAFGLMTGYVAELLVANYYRETAIGKPSQESVRSLWAYAKSNYVTSLGTFTHNWMDVFVLGFFVTNPLVAAYEIAWRVSSVLLVVTQAFSANVVPQISAWDAAGQRDRVRRFLDTGLLVTLAFVVPGSVGTFLLSEEILTLVFDEGLGAGAVVLTVLAGGRILETVSDLFGRLVMGLNAPDVGARVSVVMLVLNVGLNVTLVPTIGVIGAAIGTVVSFGAGTILLYRSASDLVAVSFPTRHVGYVFVATAVMAVAISVARQWVPVTSIPRLVGHVLLGIACYGVVLAAITPVRERLGDGVRELAAET